MPVDEGPLRWESLRFESEPWARLYMAGDIIRKLHTASEKQRKCASEAKTPDSNEE
jgi:hypothetical protein